MNEAVLPHGAAALASPFNADGGLLPPSAIEPPCAVTALGARALAEAIRQRQLSVRAVATAFLDRIERVNPALNAIVALRDRADVLKEADAADAALSRGEPTGPLHGVPIAIKDLVPTQGLTTTFGSSLYADFVPDADGLSAARIRAAGALIIGKTNTPEFGLGSHTYNTVYGTTFNAYDQSLSAGGSSGGAAVALAARLLPVADGSDMGGSLRNPAAWNNVYGLRPTIGRVPQPAQDDLFSVPLATDGPMARSAGDLALLLDVMSGPDVRAPFGLPKPDTPFSSIAPLDRPLRMMWMGDLNGHLPFEPGLMPAARQAARGLEEAGHRLQDGVPDFDFESLWQAFVVLRQHTIATRYAELLTHPRATQMKPEMRWEIEAGLALDLTRLRKALRTRSAWYRTLMGLFEETDILLLPSTAVWPFPAERTWPDRIGEHAMDSYHRWMEIVAGPTLAGLPVLALPAGFSNGLPLGIQAIGRPGSEALLLSLAKSVEDAAQTR